MKKLIALVLALICVLSFAGCQKTIGAPEVYSFPEPTILITGSFYAQGQEAVFAIGSEEYDPRDLSVNAVIQWFYGLELIACDAPKTAEGSERYTFRVNGEDVFTYEDRGSDAYLMIYSHCYKVCNPSAPPIDKGAID